MALATQWLLRHMTYSILSKHSDHSFIDLATILALV
jgi:hypothetical protein